MKPFQQLQRRLCWCICLAALFYLPAAAQDDDDKFDFNKELEITSQLIVMLTADYNGVPEYGAGIICGRSKDRLLIATAYHILHRGEQLPSKVQVKLRWMPDKMFEAKMLKHGDEATMDLAILQIDEPARKGIDICLIPFHRLSSLVPKRGQAVYPIGNPNGASWALPVAADRISQINDNNVIFQSSYISSGHSGGGLINAAARLVGMTVADEPPYGRALSMPAVLKMIRSWGYALQLDTVLRGKKIYLHLAAEKGDVKAINEQLADCGSANARDFHDATPLHYAALSGNVEAVNILLKAGADINARDADGDVPLEYAIEKGHLEAAKALVKGTAINERNDQYNTLLNIAVEQKQPAIAKLLISAGAKINDQKNGTSSALEDAIGANNIEMVKLLIEAGAKADALMLRYKIKQKNYTMVKLVLKALIDLNGEVENGTLLHSAVYEKDLEMVQLLVTGGLDINAPNSRKWTPLFNAIWYNGTEKASEIENYLFSKGGTLKGADVHSLESLLLHSVTYGRLDAVKELLADHVNPNSTGGRSLVYSLLHTAINDSNTAIAGALIKAGADINGESYGVTPVENAIRTGNFGILKLLVDAGANVDATGSSTSAPVYKLIFAGNIEAFKMLYKASKKQDKLDKAFAYACQENQLTIAEYLLKQGAESTNKLTPEKLNKIFVEACEKGRASVVEFLLTKGANKIEGVEPAIKSGQKNIIETFLKKGMAPNVLLPEDEKPLHLAAEYGQLDIVKLLVNAGANVNEKSKGETALKRAIEQKKLDCAKFLLQAGTRINTGDEKEESLLFTAARYFDRDIFQELLNNKANVNVETWMDGPLLNYAVENENVDCINMLLKAGVNINAKDRNGKNALHIAAASDSKDAATIIQLLHKAGINMNIKDDDGKTPLTIAIEELRESNSKLLQSLGAK
ncbi:ankyrin repeat domain-containing protein [Terrimonas alba]|uniref:ankyrin repeat domain-containing protein n=1 Tax=Terrimonas alba TaxID=3349636 RepID=UPI0035F4A16D